jgi:ribosomal protein S18 acetylase RimI-like enzyme
VNATTLPAERIDPAANAAVILAQAFAADPMMSYVFPAPEERTRRLVPLFAASETHATRSGGRVLSTGLAAAVWVPLGRLKMSLRDVLLGGMLALPFRVGVGAFRRQDRHEAEAEHLLAAVAPPRSAYLWSIGTLPSARGTGQGHAMMNLALETMNRFHHAVLKTENEQNLAFYSRCGFEVLARHVVTSSGLPLWILARPIGGRR